MTDRLRLGLKFSVGFSPWSAAFGLNRFCAVNSAIASAANNRDAANADVGHQSRLPRQVEGQ